VLCESETDRPSRRASTALGAVLVTSGFDCGVRDHAGERLRLELGDDDRLFHRCHRPPRRVRRRGDAGERTRSCRLDLQDQERSRAANVAGFISHALFSMFLMLTLYISKCSATRR